MKDLPNAQRDEDTEGEDGEILNTDVGRLCMKGGSVMGANDGAGQRASVDLTVGALESDLSCLEISHLVHDFLHQPLQFPHLRLETGERFLGGNSAVEGDDMRVSTQAVACRVGSRLDGGNERKKENGLVIHGLCANVHVQVDDTVVLLCL